MEWLGQKENPAGKGWAVGAGYGEKILSILKGISGTAGGTSKPAPAETEIWYRVRKSWADASSQKGAFKSLENAKKCADENPGHSVFDVNGVNIYTPKTTAFTSCAYPFSGKIICGECGGIYGSKVWHSNTPNRTLVWQCNEKNRGQHCKTPHLTEANIQAA